MAKIQKRFKVIPYDDVPFRDPRTRPSSNPGESQWDDALAAIEQGRGQIEWIKKPKTAIRIEKPISGDKATLQTMARKRGCFVEVLEHGGSVYAWGSERAEAADRCFR
jgi:hypothetical protein